MNPALDSTADFNKFVNDRLHASRKAFGDRIGNASAQRPQSKERERPSRAGGGTGPSDYQTLFVNNSARFVGNAKPSRPVSAGIDQRRKGAARDAEQASPQFTFVHSWRGHLDYKPSPGLQPAIAVPSALPLPDFRELESPSRSRELHIIQSPFEGLRKAALSPRRRTNGVSLFPDEAALSPQPSPLRARPTPSPHPYPIVPMHRPSSTPFAQMSHAESMAAVKFRTSTLRRCVMQWKRSVMSGYQRRQLNATAVEKLNRRRTLFTALRDWQNTLKAILFEERFLRFRAKLRWRAWRARRLRHGRDEHIAHTFWLCRRLTHGVCALLSIVRRSRSRQRRRRLDVAAAAQRRARLLRVCWAVWKRCVRQASYTRRLEEEHQQRQSKIRALVHSLPSSRGEAKDGGGRAPPRPASTTRSRPSRPPPSSSTASLPPALAGSKPSTRTQAGRPRVPLPEDKAGGGDLPPPPFTDFFPVSPAHSGEASPSPTPSPQPPPPEPRPRDGGAGRGGQSFDDRAAQHKERLQVLRQRALDRVHERQQAREKQLAEAGRKEEDEARRLREEAQQRKWEERQKSARTLALQAEFRRLLDKASRFRTHQLLVRRGLGPWRRFVAHARELEMLAQGFRRRKLTCRVWTALRGYVHSSRVERLRWESKQAAQASVHYRRVLMRRTWKAWKLYRKLLKAKAVAVMGQFSRYTLNRRSFTAWKVAYQRSLRETARAMRSMSERGRKVVLAHYFRGWLAYHDYRLEEREIEMRAESKWNTVQSWMNRK